jgi:hypothetical protein
MRHRLLISSLIGGVLGVVCELLSLYHGNIFSTHESRMINIMLVKSFIEGALLVVILSWRNKIHYVSTWRWYGLYFALVIIFFFVRGISMTIGLFLSPLVVVVFPLRGLLLERVIDAFSLVVDIVILVLIFLPLLTIGNRWLNAYTRSAEKKMAA